MPADAKLLRRIVAALLTSVGIDADRDAFDIVIELEHHLASSPSDRASFAAYDVEFVVEISRCRAPLHRSTTEAHRHAPDVELYSSTALQSALHLYSSTALYTLHPLHPRSALSPVSDPFCAPPRPRPRPAPP